MPLARSIADAQAIVGAELKAHDVSFIADVQPPGLSVMANEAAIASVLINLLRNAIDAVQGAATRSVILSARSHGKRVILTSPTPARASAPTSCRACSSPSFRASRWVPAWGSGW